MAHKCFVCDESAYAEVFLFDVYSDGLVFCERDVTCPFLCQKHVKENEESLKSERKPRGIVEYKYSNQDMAQGFTIYKPLF